VAVVVVKKIVFEQTGYTHQQLGVNALTLKDVIDIGSLAIEVASKPTHASLLTPEFGLNQFSDMYGGFGHKKMARVNRFIHSRGIRRPM